MNCPKCGSHERHLHPMCDGVYMDSTYICNRCGHTYCDITQAVVSSWVWVATVLAPVLLVWLFLSATSNPQQQQPSSDAVGYGIIQHKDGEL